MNVSMIQRARAFVFMAAAVLTFMVEKNTPAVGFANVRVGGLVAAVLFGIGLYMFRSNLDLYKRQLASKTGMMMVVFAWLIATLITGMIVPMLAAGIPTILAGGGVASIIFAAQLTLLYKKLRNGTPPRKEA